MKSLDLKNLPEGPFRSRAALMQFVLPDIHDLSIRFIEEEYPRRSILESALLFSAFSLHETPSADIKTLSRLDFFPWVEASWEIDWAMTHILCANYKAAHDSIRRAVELSVVAAFFLLPTVEEADARAWLRSDDQTPFFSTAVDKHLAKTDRWKALAEASTWPKSLKEIYWRLSDVIHTRGVKNATRTVQPYNAVIGTHHIAQFDTIACAAALDMLLGSVRQIAVVVVLTNPTLIVDLPIDEKFGLNPPASGVLNNVQAARLRSLIPTELLDSLERLAANDPQTKSIVEWVRSRPDLTDADFEEQVRRFKDGRGGRGETTS